MVGLRKPEVPWCTIFLVVGTMTCHTCVLVGNMKTATAMNALGSSTFGWSSVGLGISRAFNKELDVRMHQVSEQLLDALNHTTVVQEGLDLVVSLIGGETDKAVQTTKAAMLQIQAGNATSGMEKTLTKNIGPAVMDAIGDLLDQQMQNLVTLLHKLLVKIKPALLQVGQWIIKFGDKIQAGLEAFSATLDKVQKLYDQVMASLRGAGEGEADMLHETFTLFDVSNTGFVTLKDLKSVGELYSLSALQGDKPKHLLEKYDHDGDHQLSKKEMLLFVNDDSIPNSMSTILRTYARKLSEVAGNVAAAKMRDEVSLTVVNYFQLVCAKNMTKVGWVSDALGNGSLPIEFTSAVMAQLCLTADDPNLLTTADVGAIVIGKMYDLHSQHTLKAVDLMADTNYWATNGFNTMDQPRCMKMVTQWVTQAKKAAFKNSTGSNATPEGLLQTEVLEAMPAMAEQLAQEKVRAHLMDRQQCRARETARLFSSETQVSLLLHLTGSKAPQAAAKSANVERALQGGQPAKPETIVFAKYLSANATATAQRFQHMSFEYSSQSSSPLDGFATQIQGLVKKVCNFIQMMMKYATPAGIQKLEDMVEKFAKEGLQGIKNAVMHVIDAQANKSMPMIAHAVLDATDHVGDMIGDKLSEAIGTPLGDALSSPLGHIMGDILNNTEKGEEWGEQLAPMVTNVLKDAAGKPIGDLVTTILDDALEKALSAADSAISGATGHSLVQTRAQDSTMIEFQVPDAWANIVSTLGTMTNVLPQAANTLKFARKEVSKAAGNLESIFKIFQTKGPAIFDQIAFLYRLLWVFYFIAITPITCFILYYGLWAGGFCGGPQPILEEEEPEPPKTLSERCRCICAACCVCCSKYHDTQFCFWSCIIIAQILVLVIFVVSIVLCILAGVKAFISAGCSQVYVLSEPKICEEAIGTLRSFLDTFFVSNGSESLDAVCPENNLLTCDLISARMKASLILTTVFSFLAAILGLQMLIESAVLHEKARFRRMYNQKVIEEGA